eukprot:TRINITY_DN1333_c0_g1_i7.p1 TRINITY_DN1333_c0_g1~~TRINITY_DN1333_c0_g1_i7.p1  ORF type:complete len:483 (-),score=114.45 TRINITY_DN1333_c0_g1_i7:1064-2488(-)
MAGTMPEKAGKAEKRTFDMCKFWQRHIAVKIAYVGWQFHGFPAQDSSDNTVEAHMFGALRKTKLIVDRDSSCYSRCGRTDVGVSAFAQVVALKVRSKLRDHPGLIPPTAQQQSPAPAPAAAQPPAQPSVAPSPSPSPSPPPHSAPAADEVLAPTEGEHDYCAMLNGTLPLGIRALCWAPVGPSFDARRHCLFREYKYFFVREDMYIDRLRAAAALLEGPHDFRNFCKADVVNVESFERTIYSVRVDRVTPPAATVAAAAPALASANPATASASASASLDDDTYYDLYCITIRGSAFLWHQVRCMVAVLFLVGRGLEQPSTVSSLLDVQATPCKPAYEPASELPLVLYDCSLNNLHFTAEAEGLVKVRNAFLKEWNRATLQAGVMRCFVGALDNTAHMATGQTPLSAAVAAARARERQRHKCLAKRPANRSIDVSRELLSPKKRRRLNAKNELKQLKQQLNGATATPAGATVDKQ